MTGWRCTVHLHSDGRIRMLNALRGEIGRDELVQLLREAADRLEQSEIRTFRNYIADE